MTDRQFWHCLMLYLSRDSVPTAVWRCWRWNCRGERVGLSSIPWPLVPPVYRPRIKHTRGLSHSLMQKALAAARLDEPQLLIIHLIWWGECRTRGRLRSGARRCFFCQNSCKVDFSDNRMVVFLVLFQHHKMLPLLVFVYSYLQTPGTNKEFMKSRCSFYSMFVCFQA